MRRVLRWIVLLCAGAALALPVAGAVDDDYRAGALAHARGDIVGALAPLRRAAAGGHAPAQAMLGFILESAGLLDEAVGLYRQAAAQDHADGQAGLAALLLAGRGLPRNEREAFILFNRAAARGHATSIQIVADAHLRGDARMIGENGGDALTALRRAGEIDYLPAIDRLALVYRRGELGVAPDAAEAARWLARAAALRPRAATPPTGARK